MIPRRNRIFATFLATTFVAGSLAAPLSHYAWMAASRYFGPTNHHHDRSPAHSLHADGSLSQSDSDAGACSYAELFATHVSAEPANAWIIQPDICAAEHGSPLPDWTTIDGIDKVLARGPPATISNT